MKLNEKQMVIPEGYVAIELGVYNVLRDERAITHNTLSILKSMVINKYIENKKRGYSATLYCEDIAEILGIELPEVEREVND